MLRISIFIITFCFPTLFWQRYCFFPYHTNQQPFFNHFQYLFISLRFAGVVWCLKRNPTIGEESSILEQCPLTLRELRERVNRSTYLPTNILFRHWQTSRLVSHSFYRRILNQVYSDVYRNLSRIYFQRPSPLHPPTSCRLIYRKPIRWYSQSKRRPTVHGVRLFQLVPALVGWLFWIARSFQARNLSKFLLARVWLQRHESNLPLSSQAVLAMKIVQIRAVPHCSLIHTCLI